MALRTHPAATLVGVLTVLETTPGIRSAKSVMPLRYPARPIDPGWQPRRGKNRSPHQEDSIMGLLDELLGGGQRQAEYKDFANRYQQGSPYDTIGDEETLQRYKELAPELSDADYP